MKVAALVPAAGLSSRMDGFKPLLPLGRGTVLGRVAETLRQAGVENILAVAGHRAEEVSAEAGRLGVSCVINPGYQKGMFSSVRVGIEALPPGLDAVLVLPVDIPLVRPQTIGRLLESLDGAAVAYPAFAGQRGHPPLLAARILPRVLCWSGEGGLGGALEQIGRTERVREMACADANILFDLDRPEDYLEALRRQERQGRPSPAETAELLALHGVGERGLAHARAVASAAVAMAHALNEARSGQPEALPATPILDIPLVESAALLHDIAKGRPGHEAEGGRILEAAGFPDAAAIVKAHRDILLPPGSPISEREVVYLADKLFSGDRPVPILARFGEKLDRFGHDPEAFEAISGRRDRALAMLARVEAECGAGLGHVLGRAVAS